MKTENGPLCSEKFVMVVLLLISFIGMYGARCLGVYQSLDVSVSKNAVIEYGSANYKVYDLVDNFSGDDISIVKNVDTNVIGEQEVILKVSKDIINKEIPIKVEVVDKTPPVIELKKDVVYVNLGTHYDLNNNISLIQDEVDGSIPYKNISEVSEKDKNYYTFSGVNFNIWGSHNVEVKAVDKYGNVSTKNFTVQVISNGRETTIKNVAYSLLGRAYVYGGTGPYAFDCSGFVQYVYRQAGLRVSRSAPTQLYDGYEVSYSNVRVGDILVWGYGRNSVTHTAIYVGNGLMIHAANPSEGVVINRVNGWGNYTGVHIVSVRRLK